MGVEFRVLHCGLTGAMERTGNEMARGVFGAKWEGRRKTKIRGAGEISVIRRFLIRVYRTSLRWLNLGTWDYYDTKLREANRLSASQEKSPHFIIPEGSLPHSQVPANCRYPEPCQSSPRSNPTSWTSILILSSHLSLSLPSEIFSLRPSLQNHEYTSPVSHTCYMLHPSLYSWCDQPNNIRWAVQIIKFLVV